jgi:hypothetical protein
VVGLGRPSARVVDEAGPPDPELPAQLRVDVLPRERLRVLAQVGLDQVRGEVADVVAADPVADQAELLKMRAAGHRLLTEVGKQHAEAAMQRARELGAEPRTAVAEHGEAQPALLDLLEPVPGVDQLGIEIPLQCAVAQEHQVPQDVLVELLIGQVAAVEQQERVDEQRQVRRQADVERAVGVQDLRVNLEVVGEVELESHGFLTICLHPAVGTWKVGSSVS